MSIGAVPSTGETRTVAALVSSLRDIEAGVLLQAATALHHAGLLTDVEYQRKRQRFNAPR